ncbi:hypothetical protein C5Y96_15355 [Blastopirellula marina]|uniref:Uncharacterized protein n=1 Tax=Blastopirellula marina TaxID=124 RepID=A0A2S8FAF5_9BACT|nr:MULTISPECIES: hypothetical protein [Pirellulaceae]PQO29129.1 hypothetical protein C5Y96_15355 [Blastopirellula marina]RCS50320.1 hypothetical protein DTL36_15365 [Bremerella cremea]
MIDYYQAFLEAPSREGFLKLQEEVKSETDFCSAGSFVDQLADLCQRGCYEQMFEQTELMPFAWVASPSAHLYASIAAQQMGCEDDAELERFVTESILQGLLETGDGSANAPYQITYLSDRQDLLAYFSLNVEKQRLVRSPSGMMDVVTTTTGDDICFLLGDLAASSKLEDRPNLRLSVAHPRLASKRLAACSPRRIW